MEANSCMFARLRDNRANKGEMWCSEVELFTNVFYGLIVLSLCNWFRGSLSGVLTADSEEGQSRYP